MAEISAETAAGQSEAFSSSRETTPSQSGESLESQVFTYEATSSTKQNIGSTAEQLTTQAQELVEAAYVASRPTPETIDPRFLSDKEKKNYMQGRGKLIEGFRDYVLDRAA